MANLTYHVAFPISEPLKDRALQVIETIRQADQPRDHVGPLTEVIVAMTQEGLVYLFLDSLKHANVSRMHIQAVQIGVNTAKKGLEMVGRRVLKSMTSENLVGTVDYMEEILLVVEE
jgi:hypothetical protein